MNRMLTFGIIPAFIVVLGLFALPSLAEVTPTAQTRAEASFALAPLVTQADIKYEEKIDFEDEVGRWLFLRVGFETYSAPKDLDVQINIYEVDASGNQAGVIWCNTYKIGFLVSLNRSSGDVIVTVGKGSGFISGVFRLEQNLIILELKIRADEEETENRCGDAEAIAFEAVGATLAVRLFAKNKAICREFGDQSFGCRFLSVFVANIGASNLGEATFLKEDDPRRIWVNSSRFFN